MTRNLVPWLLLLAPPPSSQTQPAPSNTLGPSPSGTGTPQKKLSAPPPGLFPSQGAPSVYGAYFVTRDDDGAWGVGYFRLGRDIEPGWQLRTENGGPFQLFRHEAWTLRFEYKTVGCIPAHVQFIIDDCPDPLTLSVLEGPGRILTPSERNGVPPGMVGLEAAFESSAAWCHAAVQLTGVRTGGTADIWFTSSRSSPTNHFLSAMSPSAPNRSRDPSHLSKSVSKSKSESESNRDQNLRLRSGIASQQRTQRGLNTDL